MYNKIINNVIMHTFSIESFLKSFIYVKIFKLLYFVKLYRKKIKKYYKLSVPKNTNVSIIFYTMKINKET